MANKITKDETELVTPDGTEIVRLSVSPFNTGATNRKITFANLKAWLKPTRVQKLVADFVGGDVDVAQLAGKAYTDYTVFSNGILLNSITDYTLVGTTLTLVAGATNLEIFIY